MRAEKEIRKGIILKRGNDLNILATGRKFGIDTDNIYKIIKEDIIGGRWLK